MIAKHYRASELLHYHLTYRESESNTILIDIVFDVKFIEHFSNNIRLLEAYSLVSHSDLQHFHLWLTGIILEIFICSIVLIMYLFATLNLFDASSLYKNDSFI